MSTSPETPPGLDWTQSDIFKTPMEVAWQFDYAISGERLKNLYSKAKRDQWDAERKLDWSIEIDPSKPLVDEERQPYLRMPFMQKLSKSQRELFSAHATAQMLSQFLHGEQGALMTASVLTHAVPDYEAKLYGATQTMDEARHVEVYDKYIKKLAIIYPMSKWLKQTIDVTLKADHWAKVMIGMNMIVEGLALAAFHNMREATTCPLLRAITEGVLRDESRHVAFGHVYLAQKLKDMHPDEREDVAQFAFEAISSRAFAGGVARGEPRRADPQFKLVLENVGIDLEDFIAGIQEAAEQGIRPKLAPGQVHSFKDLMMPGLVRVGAITERTRKLLEEADIPVWEDASVLEAMEDSDTGEIVFEDEDY